MNTTRRARQLAGALAASCWPSPRSPAMAATARVPRYGARQSLPAWPQRAWWA